MANASFHGENAIDQITAISLSSSAHYVTLRYRHQAPAKHWRSVCCVCGIPMIASLVYDPPRMAPAQRRMDAAVLLALGLHRLRGTRRTLALRRRLLWMTLASTLNHAYMPTSRTGVQRHDVTILFLDHTNIDDYVHRWQEVESTNTDRTRMALTHKAVNLGAKKPF